MNDQLPDFDRLWDYDHPQATERAFRALLPHARTAGQSAYVAELLTQLARAQGLQRLFDAAHRTLDEVETLLDPAYARARIRYALERGRVINSAGQPDHARAFFLQAWDLARERGEDGYAIDAAHMLGIVEPPDQQLQWNQRALAMAERSTDARARRWRGSLYNNIGWTYHGLGQHEEALAFFQRSLSYEQEQGHAREARIATWCIGRTLRSLSRPTEALALQRGVLEQVTALGEEDGFVSEEIAECLLALGQQEDACAYFARAYDLLSRDAGLVANEAARLERLKALTAP